MRLEATFALDDLAASGHGTVFTLRDENLTRVLARDSGRLVLDKRVRNVTAGGTESTANGALPGHVLEYVVRYRNAGTGPIADLVIDDTAPAFTEVLGGSVVCGATPPSLVCTPGVAGAAVSWSFGGALGAGEAGEVRYRVSVE